jgi:fido (protein-threonine AMPylation protein)
MNGFSEYKKVGEPSVRERAQNWGIAIGLQQVDGLTPSKYLYTVARENIEGKISIAEAYKKIDAHYKTAEGKAEGADKEEVARVSARITELLSDPSFSFAPTTLFAIHDFLFREVHPDLAGKIRKYNITKDEEILNGNSVAYGSAISIMETLQYDFDNEKKFDYAGLSPRNKAEHIAKFISDIWQTHPFGEGNTRTIAVFAIKYLRTLGFADVGNELFEKYSKYFRNALVRANYQNLPQNVSYAPKYLNKFFGNLLLGENNVLDNADLQLFTDKKAKNTDKIREITDKLAGITDKLTVPALEFLAVIYDFVAENGEINNSTAQKMSGKSAESVKKYFAALVAAGVLTAVGERKARKYILKHNLL